MSNKLVLVALCLATAGVYSLQTVSADNTNALPYDQHLSTSGDTLTYFISSGEILIVNLPDRYLGYEIERYEIRSAPALSWLVERSFFWRTLGKESGSFDIVFDAISEGSRVDELVLAVNVQ